MSMLFDTLVEKFYNSRKNVKGYVESSELIGKRLWVHTNRTNRNNGYNGMVGIYVVNSKGYRTGSPLYYTNSIRLVSPIVFEASQTGAKRIATSGKRTLVAGVSGVVTQEKGSTTGFKVIGYTPEIGHFYCQDDPERKAIISASEVVFFADEGGTYTIKAKDPVLAK